MTSKEALKILFMTCNEDLLLEHYNIIFPSKLTEIIEKDLERLEKSTKQPTIEEVIEEWKRLKYKIKIIHSEDTGVEKLCIYKPTKEYIYQIDIYIKEKTYYFNFGLDYQEHNLLTKTFKALGWE